MEELQTCTYCGATVHADHWDWHRARHNREDGTTDDYRDRRYARSTTVEHARDMDPRY